MAVYFIDSSALVKRYITETRSGFEIVEANYNAPTYAEYLCIKAA
jgi:predicted nucleic acid-binding protein